jgi:hypothetical protein
MEQRINITNFSLLWRWTQPLHAVLPADALETLHPLTVEQAGMLCAAAPKQLGPRAVKQHKTEDVEKTRRWLASLPQPGGRVFAVWNKDTGLSLPWNVFMAYWSDFCYPSSDDVDLFLEGGSIFLRWNHDETFEYYGDAK